MACLLAAMTAGLVASCKKIPEDSYGIDRVRLAGMERLDPEALSACLATQERDRLSIGFGTSTEPECGVPPFDGNRVSFNLWKKLRSGWPRLDLAVLERDLKRIERWYQARGYYDATVVSTEFDPPSAASSDRIVGKGDEAPCEREDDDEGCKVSVTIEVEEGEPVLVRSIQVLGLDPLKPSGQNAVKGEVQLKIGKAFDEAIYEQSKREMKRALDQGSYACSVVRGRVEIDREVLEADVVFTATPGPPSKIGEVTVSGHRDLPGKTILGTSGLKTGQTYIASELADAQRTVYGLGAFASVNVTGKPQRRVVERAADADPSEPEKTECTGIVDVNIAVEPGRRIRWGVGFGFQGGTINDRQVDQDARISDVHLLGRFEHRNFIGGLRRLTIEDRPKLVFLSPVIFRFRNGVLFGNELIIRYRKPAFIEPRTTAAIRARHDWGPDPNDLFRRHDLNLSGELSRPFFDGRLLIAGGLNFDQYFVIGSDPTLPESFRVLFFNQRIIVDLRDDSRTPRKGAFFIVGSQQSPVRLKRSWQYIRVTPEARAYAPLPLGWSLAFRFGVGAMFILKTDGDFLDPASQELGPQSYRLRSGGPTTHRGFPPGFLGDIPPEDQPSLRQNSGGLRRWEGGVEIRIPITPRFRTALFADLGDVNRGKRFRFDHLNTAFGFGFRYDFPPLPPVRFDIGFLIPKWQVVGGDAQRSAFNIFRRIGGGVPGAVHFTIGEAF